MTSTIVRRVQNVPRPSTPTLAFSKVGVCILPIAQIAIGAVYLKECPRQPYIPIYLIVVGVFGLALGILSCLPCAQKSENSENNPLSCICTAWNSLSSLFLFCWFIAGNVWIYSIYQPNYTKNETDLETYCNKTLYLFAFWSTTLIYILLGLFLVIGCCVLCCMMMCGVADADDDV
ncbi:transmembrane protein 272-like [Kryptolebias marmoratus]|uniref:Si:dkey-19b23.12 n=1 Tax=Kryptolebias marmoratus TaxID=37003 RepID=A0A3Q3AA36_KRYMA|nr:transmembrane protein 272-like [Kryptolebias marmoratus]